MGLVEQQLAKQALRARQEMPDRIANAPVLFPGLQIYLQAFFDLDFERSHSMGATHIPFSSVVDYARAFEFDEEMTEDLIYFIRQMDIEHVKLIAKKQEERK